MSAAAVGAATGAKFETHAMTTADDTISDAGRGGLAQGYGSAGSSAFFAQLPRGRIRYGSRWVTSSLCRSEQR
jgi:hypothetical protein